MWRLFSDFVVYFLKLMWFQYYSIHFFFWYSRKNTIFVFFCNKCKVNVDVNVNCSIKIRLFRYLFTWLSFLSSRKKIISSFKWSWKLELFGLLSTKIIILRLQTRKLISSSYNLFVNLFLVIVISFTPYVFEF